MMNKVKIIQKMKKSLKLERLKKVFFNTINDNFVSIIRIIIYYLIFNDIIIGNILKLKKLNISNLKKENSAKNKSYLFRIKNTRLIELIMILFAIHMVMLKIKYLL